MARISILILLLSFIYQNIAAQLLTQELGLLDEKFNYFVFTDSYGLTWISCEGGISIYDGKYCKNYTSISDQEGRELQLNFLQSNFYEDRDQNLWFTNTSHIIKYDRFYDVFYSYAPLEIKTHYHIFYLNDSKDYFLFSADRRIGKFDITKQEVIFFDQKIEGVRFEVNRTDNQLTIISCPWINANGFEVIKIINDKLHSYEFYKLDDETQISGAIVKHENLWLISNKGLIQTTVENPNNYTVINSDNTKPRRIGHAKMYNDSLVLLTSRDLPLQFYNVKTKKFSNAYFHQSIENLNPKDAYRINITHDYIWLSYNLKGVFYIQKELLTNNVNNLESRRIVNSNNIKSYVSQDNYLFLAHNNKIEKYSVQQFPNYIKLDEWNIPRVNSFLEVDNHLFGFTDYKAFQYIDNQNTWSPIQGLNNEYINYTSSSHDNIILTTAINTYQVNINNNNFIRHPILYEGSSILNYHEENNYRLYLINNHELTIQHKQKKLVHVDGYSFIFNYTYDPVHNIYFICHEKGIDLLYLDDYKFDSSIDRSTLKPILENITTYSAKIIDSCLYAITSKGVFVYNIETKEYCGRVKNIETPNIHSNIQQYNDNIYFIHTEGGIEYFDIHTSISSNINNLNIEEVYINDIPYNSDINLNYLHELKLDYKSKHISILSNPVSLINEDISHIKYSLDGGHSWKYTSNGAPINYTFQSAGEHTISLVPISQDFIPGEQTNLVITIAPPYYQTWWFLSSVAVGLMGLGWLFSYSIAQHKLKEKQIELDRQKALSKQREKIADDLHDELGTELNKILYLSDEATFEKDANEKEVIMNSITKLASDSIKNMRDILWVLDDRNDIVQSLISRIKLSMSQTLREYKIRFVSDIQENIPEIEINNNKRKNILLILKEATNNIIKHAKASKVTLNIKIENQTLYITVKDDGIGIQDEIKPDNFGLNSMNKRAQNLHGNLEISPNPTGGTRVSLTVDLSQK